MNVPAPPWRRSGRAVKPQLSPELIVRTALELLDAEGIDAVSMRRVAQALDTGAASLYAHVSNKDELHELMFDQVLSEVELPEPDPARWAEQVREVLQGQLAAMLAHPGIAKVAWATQVPVGPHALQHGETVLALLRAGGLSEQEAAYASDALSLYTKAFAYEGSGWASGEFDQEEAAARGRQMHDYLSSMPGRFPNMLTLGKYFSAETSADRFQFGLNMLLGGLRRG